MQQRRPRLGDILDDYCPRERRITNHAVVAMIDDQVKQTRCTTCDADHPYKEAKAPAARRRKSEGALFAEVLEDARPRVLATPVATADLDDEILRDEDFDDAEPTPQVDEPALIAAAADNAAESTEDDEPIAERTGEDEWPVHRRLIRATLPRPEGQVPERKEPDFTIRRPSGRGPADGNRNGHRARPAQQRPMRHAQGQPQGHGHVGGQPARFGAPRHGGAPQGQQRQGSGHGHSHGQHQGNRAGRPGGHGQGPQHPGGGQGRKRGR